MTGPISLPAAPTPSESYWNGHLGTFMHIGDDAVEAALAMPHGLDVALDIETPSLTDSFSIKCVTAAWEQDGYTHALLLDPLRIPQHRRACQWIVEHAATLIFHNSPFDVPGLVYSELMELRHLSKVMDTIVLARAAYPDEYIKKRLEALAARVLGMHELSGALALAIKAAGFRSEAEWYAKADNHMPSYRNGAMSDTVVTLRLAHPLFELALERQLDHPFQQRHGLTSRSEAAELVMRSLRVNQIMLRRAAMGMNVDLDYLDSYIDGVQVEKDQAEHTLNQAGCRPGVGPDIVKHLLELGELPMPWPRTAPTKRFPQGQLKTDKEAMKLLPEHPLALAHRVVADNDKILQYMEKTAARSRITGRLHPQFHILGASATGRMSASDPPLQQFSEKARPIIRKDDHSAGLTSIDWSSIEPALLGWMSHDWDFITPFENGADLYAPLQASARLPMDHAGRKVAKVVVLADMYGQGVRSLARKLGGTEESAKILKRGLRSGMPIASAYMDRICAIGDTYGLALTVSGRVLTIPQFNGAYAGYVAINYTMQGSCADLLYDSIIEADRRGLADALMLPLHDELVVNAEAAAEIQEIMSTPPQRLIDWAGGRAPRIRTDNEFLGDFWRVCD